MKPKRLYEGTFIYRLYDAGDRLLYVGIANRPSERWGDHASKAWWPLVARREMERYPTREEALRAEAAVIINDNPVYNQLVPNPDGSVRGARLRADSPALAAQRRNSPKIKFIVRMVDVPDPLWAAYDSVCTRLLTSRNHDLAAHMWAVIQKYGTPKEIAAFSETEAEYAERLYRRRYGRPRKPT